MDMVVSTVSDLYKVVHAQLRKEVEGMDERALNWSPAPETNSIAALVVHTLGSEAEVLRTVRALPGQRDRDAEFRATAASASELVARLDKADRYLDEMSAGITAADLAAMRPRGDRPPQTGMYWLISNYAHAREHLGHVQLTKQVYATRQAGLT